MTDNDTHNRRALGLLSGGLDSQLAVCLMRDQGIRVETVFFGSPFCDSDRARQAAANLGVYLHLVDFTADILELIEKPAHGLGSCMNPCIDCHARMLQRTGEFVQDLKFDFMFTGEVLGQRPMSQKRQGLDTVAADSGFGDLIVRPLSGGLLPETLPERRGWIDRAKLLSIEGRSRKPQLALAEQYGVKEYPTPAGGCRLTEPNFSRRLADLRDHEGLQGVSAIERLRIGRHFRLGPKTKAIVGRNERDNALLEGSAELYDLVLKIEEIPGPTVLLPFTASNDEQQQAAAIGARYSDCTPDTLVHVKVRTPRGLRMLAVKPAGDDVVKSLMI